MKIIMSSGQKVVAKWGLCKTRIRTGGCGRRMADGAFFLWDFNTVEFIG